MSTISELTAAAALTGDEIVPLVQTGATVRTTIGDMLASGAYVLAADAMIVVKHDDNAATARPDPAGAVYWQGSVEPDNGADGDLWYDSTGDTP